MNQDVIDAITPSDDTQINRPAPKYTVLEAMEKFTGFSLTEEEKRDIPYWRAKGEITKLNSQEIIHLLRETQTNEDLQIIIKELQKYE